MYHALKQGGTSLLHTVFAGEIQNIIFQSQSTHSSVPAWRIPGTGEPGGLPSKGSHRVGHNWSGLAAAASSLHSRQWTKQHTDRQSWHQGLPYAAPSAKAIHLPPSMSNLRAYSAPVKTHKSSPLNAFKEQHLPCVNVSPVALLWMYEAENADILAPTGLDESTPHDECDWEHDGDYWNLSICHRKKKKCSMLRYRQHQWKPKC